jgi:hypothetical protein
LRPTASAHCANTLRVAQIDRLHRGDKFRQQEGSRQNNRHEGGLYSVPDRIVKPKHLALILLVATAMVVGALAFRHFKPAGKINPPVDIQEGKTIDFSSGKPVVKDSEKEKAIIDAAVKEMDEATKGITFDPAPAQPEAKKAAEPAGAQPQK